MDRVIDVGISFCSGRVVVGFFPPLKENGNPTYLQVFDGEPYRIFPKCLEMLLDSRARLVFSSKAELDRFVLEIFNRSFFEVEETFNKLGGVEHITDRLEYLLEESYNFKERTLALITFLAVRNRIPVRIYRQIFFNEIKGGK